MSKCKHDAFASVCEVTKLLNRDGSTHGFRADVRVVCAQCKMPFHWKGLTPGYSVSSTTVSIDGLELRAAIGPGEALQIPTLVDSPLH